MNKKNEKNFENALERLEEIAQLLESEDTPLEESIKFFNLEGVSSIRSNLFSNTSIQSNKKFLIFLSFLIKILPAENWGV